MRQKCRATGLDASLSSFSTSRRCSWNRSPNRLPVSTFVQNADKISGPKRSVKITDRFMFTSANVIYCITCTLCKKLYIGETGRRLGDRFREHLCDVEKDASKPVQTSLPDHPNHSKEHMVQPQKSGAKIHFSNRHPQSPRHQRTLFIQLIYSCFSRDQVPINSVAPSSVYKAYTTHYSSICSDEGLTLETSAFQSLYGGQFTLSTPLINQIFAFFIGQERVTCHGSKQSKALGRTKLTTLRDTTT